MKSVTKTGVVRQVLAAAAIGILSLGLAGGCASGNKPAAGTGAGANKNYAFWPAAPDEPRIQFLRAFNASDDIGAKKSGMDELLYGADKGTTAGINKPYGVRMWDGRIYVCDVRQAGMLVLDLKKKQARVMGASGSGAIRKAVDLAIAPDGTKYVLDPTQNAVLVYDPAERYATTFGLFKDARPVGIAVHGDRLYVSDFKNACVRVLDRPTGKEVGIIGERGGEDGQFVGPLAVTTDAQGNVYVTDTMRSRVQKFTPDGKFVMGFGRPGDRPGDFARAKQIGVGADGTIHVVDALFNNVQAFDDQGRIVGFYGSAGSHPGALELPAGLDVHDGDVELFKDYIHPAFEAERLVLVTNNFGPQKICVYAMGHLKAGKTVADVSGGRAKVDVGLAPGDPRPATQPATQPAAPAGTTTAAQR